MIRSALLFLLVVYTGFSISFAQDSPFVRNPSLNSNGTKIAFTFQGDIWTVSSAGGRAERLTIHEAYDGNPLWSYDDKHIAFNSDRYGNNDIFLIPSTGGYPARLTFHSAADELNQFIQNGDLIFSTSRTFKQVEWDSEFYKISKNGGTPVRFLDALGNMPALSPDGKFLAFCIGWGRITREAYRGSANFKIWIYDIEKDIYTKITNFDGNEIYPRWGDSETLYFISPKSGKYNIHRIKINENGYQSGPSEQITDFKDDGVRNFNISSDGSSLVLERQADIYYMKTSGGSPEKINIEISSDYRFDPTEYKTFTGDISEYALSPNGKKSSLIIRGEVFVKENDKDKSRAVNLTNHPYRDQQSAWLSDSSLVYISDREGQNELYLLRSSDNNESDIMKSFKHESIRLTDTPEDESYPVVSPDGKKLAYEMGQGKLVVAEINTDGELSNEIVLLDGWATPYSVTWSPDSKWLAYSLSDLTFNDEIYIHAADGSADPVNVSMHPRSDSSPFWSKDGKKLAFVSNRNNSNSDVWFVWLTKEDWQKTKEDWEDKPVEEKKDKKKKDVDSTSVQPVKIDFENIYQRLVQVTSLPGDEYSPLISADGETFYFVAFNTSAKKNDLYSIKWDGSEIKNITTGGQNPSQISFDREFKNIYLVKSGKLSRIDIKSEKEESLSFSAKMTIDYLKEKEQIFEEAWRALNEGFYDPDFHGRDWKALKMKYKPWCLQTSTQKDFQDIFNSLLGEVNASHMGLRGVKERSETQNEKTGLIGLEVKPHSDGVEVLKVVKNSPADKEKSKIFPGDIILSVNGNFINEKTNFYSLLAYTPDERILLNVRTKDGSEKEIILRPVSRLTSELYDEWVESRKELVDKYSNGRLGYLHIEGMDMPSFERFERELTARGLGKEGIVIDVRYNGGGWTTDYLMTILKYKQHAYTDSPRRCKKP